MTEPSFTITAFYKFLEITEDELASLRSELQRMGYKYKLQGLTLVATEGVSSCQPTPVNRQNPDW